MQTAENRSPAQANLDETEIKRLRLPLCSRMRLTLIIVSLQNELLAVILYPCRAQRHVLKRMKRKYTQSGYEKTIEMIHKILPDAAITTDVIVGFPGETEEEFLETVDFCRRMGFARIHVFPYSPRPGTAAYLLPGRVDAAVKKEGMDIMLELSKESAWKFHSGFINKTKDVLWEQKSGVGVWSGYTSNYIKVYAKSEKILINIIAQAKLIKPYRDGLWGEILQ